MPATWILTFGYGQTLNYQPWPADCAIANPTLSFIQITNPMGQYEVFEKSTSNGDHSFDAKHDGKYTYCFGNEHWGAASKEVSFNVHGIVYVSESDAPQDPLEAEGKMSFAVCLQADY